MIDDTHKTITDTIENRVRAGFDPTISGWQTFITKLLNSMNEFLSEGSIVTFQQLSMDEKNFYENLYVRVEVPNVAYGLYIPPSVRHQMMYENDNRKVSYIETFDPEKTLDSGSLLACRSDNYETIVNVLFAHPPYTPAVDVYEKGKLIAGYTYHMINECIEELSDLLQVHLTSKDIGGDP
jgi:hypothetical protein